MALVGLLLMILDPFKIIRNYVFKPIATLGLAAAEEYQARKAKSVKTTKNVFLKLIIVVLVGFSVVWASIFLYLYFYYSYMPSVLHMKDVHLNIRECKDSAVDCKPYPTANVALTNHQRFLMVGQPYKIILNLEMPESEQNGKIGMFTVCGTLKDYQQEEITSSCRMSMLHYKSDLLKTILTVVFAPLLVFGYREEKQLVTVELFSHFLDDSNQPATNIDITIQCRDIQLYSAELHVIANFTGLRYLMFNWPVLSAIIGITTNLFFILIVCLLSWYHWDDTEWITDIRDRYQQIVQGVSKVGAIEQPLEQYKTDKKTDAISKDWIVDEE
ncbi:AGAP003143-PA-like protein [Anopheles sinensis]|uniref:Seipin n=1 Tax=Anopheles sinensis TaxID=74873 RepID=A0A084VZX9_ANOSI|nr:AGAP003143-PA-like protein [Anopheles sinensis]